MTLARFALAAAVAAGVASPAMAEDAPLRIGYWTSGYSLGFGAVLEEGSFLADEGLDVEFRKFAEVNAPGQAVLTGSVDVAFAAPAAAAFNLGAQGAPVRVILATQVLEGQIVVKPDSGIDEITDLKGKKIGMSRPGSSTHALATSLLQSAYGLAPDSYAVVPGNEGPLAQLLLRGEIDAAALRNVTLAQLPEGELQVIGSLVDEWKKKTGGSAPPIIGVALTRADVLEKREKDIVAFVKATRAAVEWGSANKEAVADQLVKVANLDEKNAAAYAAQWDTIYIASLDDETLATLKEQNRVFAEAGGAKGIASDELYAPAAFEAAVR